MRFPRITSSSFRRRLGAEIAVGGAHDGTTVGLSHLVGFKLRLVSATGVPSEDRRSESARRVSDYAIRRSTRRVLSARLRFDGLRRLLLECQVARGRADMGCPMGRGVTRQLWHEG